MLENSQITNFQDTKKYKICMECGKPEENGYGRSEMPNTAWHCYSCQDKRAPGFHCVTRDKDGNFQECGHDVIQLKNKRWVDRGRYEASRES